MNDNAVCLNNRRTESDIKSVRSSLTNLRPRPTTSCSLSAIASRHITPIVV